MFIKSVASSLIVSFGFYLAISFWVWFSPEMKTTMNPEFWNLLDFTVLILLVAGIIFSSTIFHMKGIHNSEKTFFMDIYIIWVGLVMFWNLLMIGQWRVFLEAYRNSQLADPQFSWNIITSFSIFGILLFLLPALLRTRQHGYTIN